MKNKILVLMVSVLCFFLIGCSVNNDKTYTITFDSNGGSSVSAQETIKNVIEPNEPTRNGYTFLGWYLNDSIYDFTMEVTSDITLIAKWSGSDTIYTVRYYQENLEDDEYTLEDTIEYTSITDANVTAHLKTYTGFTTPEEQTITVKYDRTSIVDYYYTRNVYTISYETNGGNEIENSKLKYGSSIEIKPIRNDDIFGGWYTDIALTLQLEGVVTSDVKLYAYWQGEDKPSDYTYVIDNNECVITKYNGSQTMASIPSYIEGYSVTSIGDSAFEGRTDLTNITIPSSITNIGSGAFFGCNNLQYNTYDNGLYLGNSTSPYIILVKPTLPTITSIEINNTTRHIDLLAFFGCIDLASIVVDSSNLVYKSEGNCIIEKATNTLILGCKNSITQTVLQV